MLPPCGIHIEKKRTGHRTARMELEAGMSADEYRTEFSLWALGGSSVLVATDLRNMSALMRSMTTLELVG